MSGKSRDQLLKENAELKAKLDVPTPKTKEAEAEKLSGIIQRKVNLKNQAKRIVSEHKKNDLSKIVVHKPNAMLEVVHFIPKKSRFDYRERTGDNVSTRPLIVVRGIPDNETIMRLNTALGVEEYDVNEDKEIRKIEAQPEVPEVRDEKRSQSPIMPKDDKQEGSAS